MFLECLERSLFGFNTNLHYVGHFPCFNWLSIIFCKCRVGYRNQTFSIRRKDTYTPQEFVPSHRMFNQILTYVRVALATTDIQKMKYRQLMRSTWRIATMVLPEQRQWHIRRTEQSTFDSCGVRAIKGGPKGGTGRNLNIELDRKKLDQ